MRSGRHYSVSGGDVRNWAVAWLLQAKLVKDHGWRCTAVVVLDIVLRAAARCVSISAACRDLANGPSDHAVMTALERGLPRTLVVLERRLNDALTHFSPRILRRCKWDIAIDWHLTPYYGEPFKTRNEIYYGKPRQGTKNFHAYATACIISRGERYTVALTWVRRNETAPVALKRLLAQIRKIGLKIRRFLLDRAFFNLPVVQLLQAEEIPFLMPVMFRGRPSKKRRITSGLRWIKRQAAGWYKHVMKNGRREATVKICVGYRRHRNRKDGKQVKKKLFFAAWRVHGSPVEIRELYRKRFGIETSYRQMRQAKIYTCTRHPHLRLFFVAVALLLRNLWLWIHQTKLADGTPMNPEFHLERLRFKRMLDWIGVEIQRLYHDGSTPYVASPP